MDDLDALQVKLNELAANLPTVVIEPVLIELGVAARKDAETSVNADIGGNTFSGWARAPITFGFELSGPTSIDFGPRKRAQGPAKVAERGRRAGSKYSRKRGRVVSWGSTRGKQTWSDAVAIIREETPRRALNEIYKRLKVKF